MFSECFLNVGSFDNKCQGTSISLCSYWDSSVSVNMLHRQAAYLTLSLSHIMNGSYSLLTETVGALVLELLHSMHLGKLWHLNIVTLQIHLEGSQRAEEDKIMLTDDCAHIYMNLENNAWSFSWQAKLWRGLPTAALLNYSSDGFLTMLSPTFCFWPSSVVPVIGWLYTVL